MRAVKHHLANARSKAGAETTAQLVWILAPRLPEPESAGLDEHSQPASTNDRGFSAGTVEADIVRVRLGSAAYAHGYAPAPPEWTAVARPTGAGREMATDAAPIDGRRNGTRPREPRPKPPVNG